MQMAHQDIQSGLLAKQGRQFAGGRLSATVGNAAVIWTFIGSLPALSGCTTDEPAADGKTAKKRITTVDYWMGGTRFVFPAELGQDGGGSPQHKPNRYRGLHGTPRPQRTQQDPHRIRHADVLRRHCQCVQSQQAALYRCHRRHSLRHGRWGAQVQDRLSEQPNT